MMKRNVTATMLVYLKIINLSTFKVASLEVSKLSQLSMLAVLDVQNNAIASVPPELGKINLHISE